MRTSTPRPSGTSPTLGFFKSARWTLPLLPGKTAIAFMFLYLLLSIRGRDRQAFCRLHILFATLLQQLGDQRCPSGLVTGADASPAVPGEVLVERNQVAP